LADRFPEVAPHWYPKDIKQRAKVNMYLDWHHGHTRAHLFKHLYENFTAAKQLGRPYNYAEASKTLPYVQKTLRECNDYLLSDAPYVAGLEQVSLADLFLYCEISQLILMTEPDQSVKDSSFVSHLENIRQWMTKMEQLPHHDEVHKLLPIIKEKFRNVPLIQF
jgi:glutathione S-transferase